jgi:ADP-ribose pyrophosphatase YjhB (NUDIX family)
VCPDGPPRDPSPPVSVRSRRAVERRLARLRERFGEFPVETLTVENDPERFAHGVDTVESGHVGSAGAVVRADDRVLLIRHPDGPVWGPPGGGHEPGERLVETARREVREETGVACRVTGVALATRKRYVHADDPERRGYLLEVLFDADHVRGDPDASADDEVLAAAWVDVDDLPDERVDRLDRLV